MNKEMYLLLHSYTFRRSKNNIIILHCHLGLNPTKSNLFTSKSINGKTNSILLTDMFIRIKIKHNKHSKLL